jgi:hypothetical protein
MTYCVNWRIGERVCKTGSSWRTAGEAADCARVIAEMSFNDQKPDAVWFEDEAGNKMIRNQP